MLFFSVDKLTGALYLGELVRRMCLQLCVDGHMFSGQMPERLQLPDSFPAKYISEIVVLVSFSFVSPHGFSFSLFDIICVVYVMPKPRFTAAVLRKGHRMTGALGTREKGDLEYFLTNSPPMFH